MSRPEPRRPGLAVTGLGLITGLGLDAESTFAGLCDGRCPARTLPFFDAVSLKAGFGVPLPDGAEDLFRRRIKKHRREQMTRGTRLAVVCGEMALEHAGLQPGTFDRERAGVVVGVTGTGYAEPAGTRDPQRILRNMPNASASWLSLAKGLAGPAFTVSTACSSGIYALAAAGLLIESGQCDWVLAGAADASLNEADLRGFADLMALSEDHEAPERASRPFDARRTGFVMGEGGGFVVLEHPEHARARAARVLATMPPPALTSEVYNILSPTPGGDGMARTMRRALDLAGLGPEAIGYLNAHGTSTRLNDLYETQAIRQVFGEHALTLPVSSTKSLTGHCLAGAAGVEAVISVLALDRGVLPPTANLEVPDPALGLDFVPNQARVVSAPLDHVMCNAFAFGGHNGVVIFSRPEA